MRSKLRVSVAAAVALVASSAANAGSLRALQFRDQAAEINAAAKLLSAYGSVTSTFRTIAHNKAVGGVPNSYHLFDRAIDIARRPGIAHAQIEAALTRAGYKLVESLDEHDHSHFAFAPLLAVSTAAAHSDETTVQPPKPFPRVAADEHGTLSIDLDAQSGSAASPSIRRQ